MLKVLKDHFASPLKSTTIAGHPLKTGWGVGSHKLPIMGVRDARCLHLSTLRG